MFFFSKEFCQMMFPAQFRSVLLLSFKVQLSALHGCFCHLQEGDIIEQNIVYGMDSQVY